MDQKKSQWNVFLENVALDPGSLADVTTKIAEFIMPHTLSAAKLEREDENRGQPDRRA